MGVVCWRSSSPALCGTTHTIISLFSRHRINIVSIPENPAEGQNVTFSVERVQGDIREVNWFRGLASQGSSRIFSFFPGNYRPQRNGVQFTNREFGFHNGSIQITGLKHSDAGQYNVVILLRPKEILNASIDLRLASKYGSSTYKAVCLAAIRWLQNGKPLRSCSRIQLSNNKQTLTIQPVLRRDAGAYQCHISNLFSARRSDTTIISVIYGPDPPFINETINLNEETVSLTCVAVAYPNTTNEWYYNGQLVENNPKVLIRKIVPENSGYYSCRATNPKSMMTATVSLSLSSSTAATVFHLARAEKTVPIVLNPPNPMEKLDVMLHPPKLIDGIVYCKIDTKEHLIVTLYLPPLVGNTTGPYYTKREVAGFGCSLLIKNLHLADTGTYVVTMNGPSVDGKGDIKIQVLGMVYLL
uniref:Ig-like domain-containing protein n=1 Tax=Pseudonaja textilis TaxID=8673 RepID=A0A670ZYA7_PSETE